MAPTLRLNRKTFISLFAVAAVASICYHNTFSNELVFDDLTIIVDNPLVTDPDTSFADIFRSHYWQHVTPTGNLYRPLTILSYRLNHAAGGLVPAGYHAVNLLLHVICSCLVFVLGRRLGLGAASALAGGALFAAHPIHTEAVTGIVGRAELLAALGVLAGCVLHLAVRRPSLARAGAVALCLIAGFLSKENAVVLPALLLACDIRRVRGEEIGWRDPLRVYVLCGLVLIVWLGLRAWILPPVEPGSISESVFAGEPFWTRVLTALSVQARYLQLLVAPIRMSADYSYAQIPVVTSILSPLVLIAVLALGSMLVFGSLALARSRASGSGVDRIGLCAILYLLAMAPTSNLLVPIGTIMAERTLYLPSVFFCLALPAVWMLPALRGGAAIRAGAAGTVLLVALYGARTVSRNLDWKDQLTLFEATVAASPRSAKARYNLGVALQDSGRDDEALASYFAAIDINPADAKPLRNAGLILASKDRLPEAIEHLERAAAIDPDLKDLLSDLGVVYARSGRRSDAEAAFREALACDPEDHGALYNLGSLLLSEGRLREALRLLERAVSTDETDADARYQLGLGYRLGGRPGEAVEHLRAALDHDPDLGEAHLELALAYLEMQDRVRASASARKVLEAGLALPPELRRLLR